MPTRLTSNSLIVSGIEAIKGQGAAIYDVLVAEQASNIEIISETIEATLINPSFGAAKKIPTKKGTKVGISLLPTGWKGVSASTGADVGNFLESSAFPVPQGVQFFECDFTTTALPTIRINMRVDNAAISPSSVWRVVAITETKLVLYSPTGTSPVNGDTLNFEGIAGTGTVDTTPNDITGSVYALDSVLANHKSVSSKFWFDDIVYQSDGIQGGFTWTLEELPKFLFEGEGTYVKPVDAQTNTSTSSSSCTTNLLIENLEVHIDGVPIHNKACFEPIEIKTNVTQTKPTIPGVDCTASITTDVKPTITLTFSQIDLSTLPIYQDWEDSKAVDIAIKYGDNTPGRNFLISAANCTLDAAPTVTDVNGVQYTSVTYNVSKPCGVMIAPNMAITVY
jgi:hypothetical protein